MEYWDNGVMGLSRKRVLFANIPVNYFYVDFKNILNLVSGSRDIS
jgi:hypothetical protein